MRILLYVGPAPWRDLVLQYSVPIIEQVATSLTLVTDGGNENQFLLHEAADRLPIRDDLPLTLYAVAGDAQTAILTVTREHAYDLVILGRLHQPLGRLLPGAHSKTIVQRLEPSVLRVHGLDRPIKHILLASGGDRHTFDNVRVTARLAVPLQASVTMLHVLSQQSLIFGGFTEEEVPINKFLAGTAPEARTLREAGAELSRHGVPTQVKVRGGAILDEILANVHTDAYELLVIGAHCVTSPLDRILLENITGDLLSLCPIPVLVVKA